MSKSPSHRSRSLERLLEVLENLLSHLNDDYSYAPVFAQGALNSAPVAPSLPQKQAMPERLQKEALLKGNTSSEATVTDSNVSEGLRPFDCRDFIRDGIERVKQIVSLNQQAYTADKAFEERISQLTQSVTNWVSLYLGKSFITGNHHQSAPKESHTSIYDLDKPQEVRISVSALAEFNFILDCICQVLEIRSTKNYLTQQRSLKVKYQRLEEEFFILKQQMEAYKTELEYNRQRTAVKLQDKSYISNEKTLEDNLQHLNALTEKYLSETNESKEPEQDKQAQGIFSTYLDSSVESFLKNLRTDYAKHQHLYPNTDPDTFMRLKQADKQLKEQTQQLQSDLKEYPSQDLAQNLKAPLRGSVERATVWLALLSVFLMGLIFCFIYILSLGKDTLSTLVTLTVCLPFLWAIWSATRHLMFHLSLLDDYKSKASSIAYHILKKDLKELKEQADSSFADHKSLTEDNQSSSTGLSAKSQKSSEATFDEFTRILNQSDRTLSTDEIKSTAARFDKILEEILQQTPPQATSSHLGNKTQRMASITGMSSDPYSKSGSPKERSPSFLDDYHWEGKHA